MPLLLPQPPAPAPVHSPLSFCRRDKTERDAINVYKMDGMFPSSSEMMQRKDRMLSSLKRNDDYKMTKNFDGFSAVGILAQPVTVSVGSCNAMALHFLPPNSEPQVMVEIRSRKETRQLLLDHLKDQLRCGLCVCV